MKFKMNLYKFVSLLGIGFLLFPFVKFILFIFAINNNSNTNLLVYIDNFSNIKTIFNFYFNPIIDGIFVGVGTIAFLFGIFLWYIKVQSIKDEYQAKIKKGKRNKK